MKPKALNRYNKRVEKIKKNIFKTYKNEKFEFIRHPYTLHVEVVINDVKKITLLPNNKWVEIKRHIDKKLTNPFFKDCKICCEPILRNISCPKCSNNYCAGCYINIFIQGEGISTCPFCRFSYGVKVPPYLVNLGVQEIKCKLGMI